MFDFLLSRRSLLGLGTVFATAALVGCGGSSASDQTSPAGGSGASDNPTVTPGKLTVATGQPAWEPWVMNDDPESGEGFEAAVVYALAEKMGYAKEDVVWVRTTFEEAYAPGDHVWDLNVQQVSINDDRKKAVDFSPAYYRPTQAIVCLKDSKYASATALADFADATIAVCVGSTAYDYVKDLIKGGSEKGIEAYNDNADAAAAVGVGQADAIVADTPDAVYMAGDQIEGGVVVGQIPGTEDEYGIAATLAKNSPLLADVTKAMDELLADGTIDELTKKWLASYTTDVPTLAK